MDPILIAALTALAPDAVGPVVANLHAILDRLGLAREISRDEITAQRFGPGTVRAVAALFRQFGLGDNPTGVIEENLAGKINEALVDKDILVEARGGIVDADGHPATGYTVLLHDVNNLDGSAAASVIGRVGLPPCVRHAGSASVVVSREAFLMAECRKGRKHRFFLMS